MYKDWLEDYWVIAACLGSTLPPRWKNSLTQGECNNPVEGREMEDPAKKVNTLISLTSGITDVFQNADKHPGYYDPDI